MKPYLDLVKRLSIGNLVAEPLETHVDMGLNHIGTGTFDLPAERCSAVSPNQSCRLYIGTSDKFTVLLFHGLVSRLESPRSGVTRIHAHQRCAALEKDHAISLPDCTALHVLQELVDATGIPFTTADANEPGNGYLKTAVAHYTSEGPMLKALSSLGGVYGVRDAVWYEQPDGRIFWGSWGKTPMAQTPLPLEGNVIRERDLAAHRIQIPAVPSLRPGMLIHSPDLSFRIEKLHLEDSAMRLEWIPGIV